MSPAPARADECHQLVIRPRLRAARSQCADFLDRGRIDRRRGLNVVLQVAELRRRGEAMQQLIPGLAAHDPGAVPNVLRAEGWLVGTPDQIIVQLQALADEGVERVMFQHNDQTDFEALELLARDVLPVVAAWP